MPTHPDLGRATAAVREKVEWIRALADEQGRHVRFGIRLDTILRDTADAAWAQADKLIDALDDETVRSAQAGLSRSQSEGQRRMRAFHEANRADGSWNDARSREIAPNPLAVSVWSAAGRGGHSYPHLEELFWFGEGVVPILRERALFDARRMDVTPASIPFVSVVR